uniref:Uncharacterized protein n=1 Tax=Rhizophora mucronata TaxID=61149 RepID=A0A2P2IY37_RHIMU
MCKRSMRGLYRRCIQTGMVCPTRFWNLLVYISICHRWTKVSQIF